MSDLALCLQHHLVQGLSRQVLPIRSPLAMVQRVNRKEAMEEVPCVEVTLAVSYW